MEPEPMFTPANIIAALLTLAPFLAAAFFPTRFAAHVRALPRAARLLCPSLLAIPYLLVAGPAGIFRWSWFALYALLPVAIALLLSRAAQADPDLPNQRGRWQDFLVLAILGLSVDLRWFQSAWPAHLIVFNKVLLLDLGLYGFLAIRPLTGVGFDLRLRPRDFTTGLRELLLYLPIALALGLSLGFLHFHGLWPVSALAGLDHWGIWSSIAAIPIAWFFTFFFIAVPEELFFRGWLQNLLERRLGRTPALIVTAILFGLSHFNKRAVQFNWRYVLLAAIAGIFYGRAWRRNRRVAASAVTHASVDAIWSLWLR
jgi:membrane protease YdiL (CAAX protease family)